MPRDTYMRNSCHSTKGKFSRKQRRYSRGRYAKHCTTPSSPLGKQANSKLVEAKRMLGLVSSDKITVTNSDYFDIYTSHPVELGEHITTLSQYADLNEGIPLAQNTHLLDGRTL